MALLSLLPQIQLWLARGRDWNGAYVSSHSDEPLYSAYVNALIDGRARKNDPFGGKDDSSKAPLPESIFSIQFVPAYAIALPARMFGLSASTAFIVLSAAAAVFASLSVFGLLNNVTGDHRVAAAGTLFVLCLGGLALKFGLFGTPIDIPLPVLLFLRRYQPAAAFPLFFVFQVFVWRALTGKDDAHVPALTIAAGLVLALLVFSYLYLWTAAAAWLACIGALWLCFRPSDRRKTVGVLTVIGAVTAITLVPYVYLISHQATVDEQLILISTHRPDLLRFHEIVGAIILVALLVGTFRNKTQGTDSRVLFAASLALLPFIVFNQQILTGKAMQSFHFETYVVNYSTMVALVITVVVFWRSISRRFLLLVATLSFACGLLLAGLLAQSGSVASAIARDPSIPVFLRLKELSKVDGTSAELQSAGQSSNSVFSPDVSLTKWLPTWTSQGTLIDQTGIYCGTLTLEGAKELFFMHLHYSNVGTEAMREVLKGTQNPSSALVSAPSVIFGQARTFPELNVRFNPIQADEIEREVRNYEAYAASFSREKALKRPIAYAVVAAEDKFDFSNLDRWYERDAGEPVGDYTLYRLKLRD